MVRPKERISNITEKSIVTTSRKTPLANQTSTMRKLDNFIKKEAEENKKKQSASEKK